KDKLALQRIKDASEKAKRELSNVSETEINLPFITSTSDGPKHLLVKLSRSKFNDLTKDLVNRSIDCMNQTLKDVDLSLSDIDDIILVGGTTRIPAIQEKLKQLSNKDPKKDINPDEVVATGAAIVAGSLQGDVKDLILLDVTPLTLSIETLGGISTPMIEKNTYIPAKKTETFSTAADNQTAVSVHVLQGERKMASDNKTLANFVLDGIAPAPRGVPQIEVSFDIDKNGILNVSAVDKKTGKQQSVKIEASTNLSKEEIERMKQEAKENEEKDMLKKEFIDLKNQSEQLIYTAQTSLKDNQDKISDELKQTLNDKIKDLQEAKDKDVSKENKDLLKEKFDDLSKTISEIGSQVYKDDKPEEGQVEREEDDKK
ncbi:MAG: Hsp70 family protein, partial [Candidatus Pacebacteria bacterium]|nr:Hsp70 family protein [Candidatus Paceibacterota bacterium]